MARMRHGCTALRGVSPALTPTETAAQDDGGVTSAVSRICPQCTDGILNMALLKMVLETVTKCGRNVVICNVGISKKGRNISRYNSSKILKRSSTSAAGAALVDNDSSVSVVLDGPIMAAFAMSGMGASMICALAAKSSVGFGSWEASSGLSWW